MRKLHNMALTVISAAGILISLFLTIYSLRYTVRRLLNLNGDIIDMKDNPGMNLLWIAGAGALVFIVARLVNKCSWRAVHVAAVIVSVLAAGLGCYLVYSATSIPIVDQAQIYTSAEAFYTGDTEWIKDYSYFRMYPFQFGLVELYALLFRLFGGPSAIGLQYVQAAATGASVYFGFRVTRVMFRNTAAACVYLLCAVLFLPMYLFSLLIYGEAFGVFFALAGVWCFLEANWGEHSPKGTVIFFVLGFLSMASACVMRGAFLIAWIAMALIQALVCIRRKKLFTLLFPVLGLLFILAAQRLAAGIAGGIVGAEYDGGMPKILWISMGLQENKDNLTGPGYYNCYSADLYTACDFDAARASDIAWEDIRERLAELGGNPGEFISFFKRKILTQWNEPSYGVTCLIYYLREPAEWVGKIINDDLGSNPFLRFTNRFQSICNLSLLGYFIHLLFRKEDEKLYLPGLIFIGGFLFSILWEAGSRYVYPYVVLVLPCVAGSLVFYTDRLAGLFRNCRKTLFLNGSGISES